MGENQRVTLTFDNGPTVGVTDLVLDVLAAKRVLATFFVVGAQLRLPGCRDLARRARAEGHQIGHHTSTHTRQLGTAPDPDAVVHSEIASLAPELAEFVQGEKLFRPYAAGGVLDRRVLSPAAVRYLEAERYACVLWNSVPRDWEDPEGWVDRAVAQAESQDWTVTVLHDIDSGAMTHLEAFIDKLRGRDIQIVQEFPDSCTPIRHGQVRQPLSHLMPILGNPPSPNMEVV